MTRPQAVALAYANEAISLAARRDDFDRVTFWAIAPGHWRAEVAYDGGCTVGVGVDPLGALADLLSVLHFGDEVAP